MQQQKWCTALMVLVAIAFLYSNAFSAVTDGLVGKWSFDEGQGGVARDEIGGHDGTVERATWTTDAQGGGYALEFSPAEDTKVTVAHSNDFFGADGSFTVANWAKPLSRGAMMDKSDKVNRIQWYILEEDPGWRFHWGGGPGFTFSPYAANWGQWHHCAWVHSPTASTSYLDGVAIHTEPDMGPIVLTSEPMYFGDMGILAAGNPRQQNFEGVLDEFHIWNRALSADEIMQFFQGGGTAVSPKSKLAITWAALKTSD